MKNPNPSETTSTGIPAARAASANGRNAAVVRLRGGLRPEPPGPRDQPDLPGHQLAASPTRPASYSATYASQSAGHELGHERVADVGLGDRPVVVDEQRDRRRAGGQRRDRERGAGRRRGRVGQRAGHRRRHAAPSRAVRRTAAAYRGRRVSHTPRTMTAPPSDLRRARPARRARSRRAGPPRTGRGTAVALTRVGPTSRIAWNRNTLAMPAASAPRTGSPR